MPKITSSNLNKYQKSALKTGLSIKASIVYVTLLEQKKALLPKQIISFTNLHRQYVYDAIHELEERELISKTGTGKIIKYSANNPEIMIRQSERERVDILEGVNNLFSLYNKNKKDKVDIISGSQAVIEAELKILEDAEVGDYLDIIGGGGLDFEKLFSRHLEKYAEIINKKKIKLRYIGTGQDVINNKTISPLKNESRILNGLGEMVGTNIRSTSVTICIYKPEIIFIRIYDKETIQSQKKLFELLWKIAK